MPALNRKHRKVCHTVVRGETNVVVFLIIERLKSNTTNTTVNKFVKQCCRNEATTKKHLQALSSTLVEHTMMYVTGGRTFILHLFRFQCLIIYISF